VFSEVRVAPVLCPTHPRPGWGATLPPDSGALRHFLERTGATIPTVPTSKKGRKADKKKKKEETTMEDKLKGRMKEAYGAITGDELKKAEGRAQQRAAQAAEEAAQKERTRQARAKAEEAERERARQELKDKGLLGSVGDTLGDTLPKL
jgi:uncharacterized protein YjbJ (UPF0337 family)